MVQVENLVKTFDDTAGAISVLQDLSFSLKRGEKVALVGVSGSGKTTLLQIIGALDKFNSGRVTIDGVDIKNSSVGSSEMARFRARNIGFVFQFHHLLPDFTALENILMGGMILGKSKKSGIERAQSLLDSVGLGNRGHHFPSELSGGERQRIALARALFNKPGLVLADEPTGALDSNSSEELLNIIEQANKEEQQTFLIATHNKELAERMDRVLTLENGKIVSK